MQKSAHILQQPDNLWVSSPIFCMLPCLSFDAKPQPVVDIGDIRSTGCGEVLLARCLQRFSV